MDRVSEFYSRILKPRLEKFDLFDKTIRVPSFSPPNTPLLEYPMRMGPIFILSIQYKRLSDCFARLGPWREYAKWWPGVDGKTIDKDQLMREGKMVPYTMREGETTLRRGEIGCYLAHYTLWKHIVDNNINEAYILEDDANFTYSETSVKRLNKMLDDLPHDCDLIYVGHTDIYSPERIVPNTEIGVPQVCPGAFSYRLTLKGAQKLVSRSMPIRQPLDMHLMAVKSEVTQYSLEPRLHWVVPIWSETGNVW